MQCLIETAGERTGGALYVETKAAVANPKCCFIRYFRYS